MSSDPVLGRYLAKVDMSAGPDECWPWGAYINDAGYGQFWDGERLVRAHRYAYRRANDREADGEVDHTCHNDSGCAGGRTCPHRRCCNPLHLEDVTHRENVRRGQAGLHRVPWKTHCNRNHEYTPENQYIDTKGHQACRKCAAMRQRLRRESA